jgi:hypothetical protein
VSQVGGQSQTKLVAGKIAHEARDGKPPALLAKGSASLNQAIKVRSGHSSVSCCERQSNPILAARAAGDSLVEQMPFLFIGRRPTGWNPAGRLWRWRGSTSRRTKQTSRASRHSVTGEHLRNPTEQKAFCNWVKLVTFSKGCHMLRVFRLLCVLTLKAWHLVHSIRAAAACCQQKCRACSALVCWMQEADGEPGAVPGQAAAHLVPDERRAHISAAAHGCQLCTEDSHCIRR